MSVSINTITTFAGVIRFIANRPQCNFWVRETLGGCKLYQKCNHIGSEGQSIPVLGQHCSIVNLFSVLYSVKYATYHNSLFKVILMNILTFNNTG